MKPCLGLVAALAVLVLPSGVRAVGLSDLASPDDVMLRRPAQKDGASARQAADAAAAQDVERRFQEARARAEAEQKAKAAAEQKQREEAARKAAAEQAAREEAARKEAEAELKRLREQVKAAEAARAKAEAEAKRAAEERAAAETAKKKAEEVAEKAAEEKRQLARRADYLAHPDPDERPAKRPQRLVAAGGQADVTETMPAVVVEKPGRAEKAGKGKPSASRPAVITADRTDYDRKEGVILFDRNVYVDDAQYKMHADRLFVFLDGTNDLKRLVALGNVAITNEARTAACAKAVYTKAASRIVMYGDERGPAVLSDGAGKKGGGSSTVRGQRITYWLDTGVATVEKPVIEMPAMKGGNSPKDLFRLGSGKDE